MNDIIESSAGPPISGNAYEQNRKLLALLRETIAWLDDFECMPQDYEAIRWLSNHLEAEVSIICGS